MSISKVQFDGHDLINLEGDTVTTDKLLSGYTAHDSNGDIIVGTYVPNTTPSEDKVGIVYLRNHVSIYSGVNVQHPSETPAKLIIRGGYSGY